MAAAFPQVVLNRLLSAFEGIKEADGYNTTVDTVELFDPSASRKSGRPHIEIRDQSLERVLDSTATGGWSVEQSVEVTALVEPIEHEDRNLGDVIRELRQDLFDALISGFDPLGADPFQADLRVINIFYLHEIDENAPCDGVRAELTIRYRHDLLDQTKPLP